MMSLMCYYIRLKYLKMLNDQHLYILIYLPIGCDLETRSFIGVNFEVVCIDKRISFCFCFASFIGESLVPASNNGLELDLVFGLLVVIASAPA